MQQDARATLHQKGILNMKGSHDMSAPAKSRGGITRKITVALVALLSMVLGTQVLSSVTAHAGAGCNNSLGLVCGRTFNDSLSSSNVNTHDSWGSNDGTPAGNVQQVAPGHWSTFRDTDGYCIPPNVDAYVYTYVTLMGLIKWEKHYSPSTGWRCQKISDIQTAIVFAYKSAAKAAGSKVAGVSPNTSSPGGKPSTAYMKTVAKKKVKAKAISVCKVAKAKAKTQKSSYYKKYKKYFEQCAKYEGIKVPKG
jgi:hypothetical protein